MKKRTLSFLIISIIFMLLLPSCGGSSGSNKSGEDNSNDGSDDEDNKNPEDPDNTIEYVSLSGKVLFSLSLQKSNRAEANEISFIEITSKAEEKATLNTDGTFEILLPKGSYKATAVSRDNEIVTIILVDVQKDLTNVSLDYQSTTIASYVESSVESSLSELSISELDERIFGAELILLNAEATLIDKNADENSLKAAIALLAIFERISAANASNSTPDLQDIATIKEQITSTSIIAEYADEAIQKVLDNTGGPVYVPLVTGILTVTSLDAGTINNINIGLIITISEVSEEVLQINHPPVANAGDDISVGLTQTVFLNGSGSYDPDGDTLNYQWSQTAGTPVILSSITSASTSFVTNSTEEVLTFQLIVSDGQIASEADTVNITTSSIITNTPPTANAGQDQNTLGGILIELDGSGSYDTNGDNLTYQWTQTQGTAVLLSSHTAEKPTFITAHVSEDLIFSLVVNDGLDSSIANTVTITVKLEEPNTPPIADNGDPDQNPLTATAAAANSYFTLDGSASYDPDTEDSITFSWYQISGPTVTLSDSHDPKPYFMVPLSIGQNLEFVLVVSDGLATDITEVMKISIGNENQPTLNPASFTTTQLDAQEEVPIILAASNSSSSEFFDVTYEPIYFITGFSNGTVSLNTDGNIVFTPIKDFFGTVTLGTNDLLVTHTNGGTSSLMSSSLTLNWHDVNDAPSLPTSLTSVTMSEGTVSTSTTITITDVDLNYTNVTGDIADDHRIVISDIEIGAGSRGGTVGENIEGYFTFTSNTSGYLTLTSKLDFTGEATISLTLSDRRTATTVTSLTDTQKFKLTVTNVNDTPVIDKTKGMFILGTPITLTEDATSSVNCLTSSTQQITITDPDFSNPTSPGTITISASMESTASGTSATYAMGVTFSGTLDATTSIYTTSSICLTPPSNFFGNGVITFTVSDGSLTDTGTVAVFFNDVNDPPVLPIIPTLTVDEDGRDTSNTISYTDVDFDFINGTDDHNLTVTGITITSGGTISNTTSDHISAFFSFTSKTGGFLTVDTASDFTGTATISICLKDRYDAGPKTHGPDAIEDCKTFTVNVTNINDTPTITAPANITTKAGTIAMTFTEDTAKCFTLPADHFTFNDPDLNNPTPDTHTFSATMSELAGTVSVPATATINGTLDKDGTNFCFTPAKDFAGIGYFNLKITDNGAGALTSSAIWLVNVTNVNDAPTIDLVFSDTEAATITSTNHILELERGTSGTVSVTFTDVDLGNYPNEGTDSHLVYFSMVDTDGNLMYDIEAGVWDPSITTGGTYSIAGNVGFTVAGTTSVVDTNTRRFTFNVTMPDPTWEGTGRLHVYIKDKSGAIGTTSFLVNSRMENITSYSPSFTIGTGSSLSIFGTDRDDLITGMTTDSAGNVYLCGTSTGTSDFFEDQKSIDDYTAQTNTDITGATTDMFVMKLDDSGQLLWFKQGRQIHSNWPSVDDGANSIVLGPNEEDIYIAGYRGTGVNRNAMLYKFTNAGTASLATFDLAYTFSGAGTQEDEALTVTTEGTDSGTGNYDVYVGGYFESTSLNGSVNGGAAGTRDAFVARFITAAGSTAYNSINTMGNGTNEEIRAMAVNTSDELHVTGIIGSDQGFGNGYEGGTSDGFVRQYADSDLTTINWNANPGTGSLLNNPGAADSFSGITIDSNDFVYLSGATSSTNIIIHKLTAAGTYDNTSSFPLTISSGGTDIATGIASDRSNDIYITGYTTGSLSGALTAANEFFILKYNDLGALHPTHYNPPLQFHSLGSQLSNTIAIDSNDEIYIGGSTTRALTGQNKRGIVEGGADTDGFIIKYGTTSTSAASPLSPE